LIHLGHGAAIFNLANVHIVFRFVSFEGQRCRPLGLPGTEAMYAKIKKKIKIKIETLLQPSVTE